MATEPLSPPSPAPSTDSSSMRSVGVSIITTLVACYPATNENIPIDLRTDALEFVGAFAASTAVNVYAVSLEADSWVVNGSTDSGVDIGPASGVPVSLPHGDHRFASLRLGPAVFTFEADCSEVTDLKLELEIRDDVEDVVPDCRTEQARVTLLTDDFCPLVSTSRGFNEYRHTAAGTASTAFPPNKGWKSVFVRAPGCL